MKKISVTNFKGIRGTVETQLDGTVVVQGKNAAGKSSFIDAITELFDARGIKLTPKPIHNGQETAEAEYINSDLDVRIVRKWRYGKDGVSSEIAVFSIDGAKHKAPAQVISDLTGGAIFDPLRFLNLGPQDQLNEILKKVKFRDPDFNLEKFDAAEADIREARREAYQEKVRAEGALTNAEQPAEDTPNAPINTAELVAELQTIERQNSERLAAEAEYQKYIDQHLPEAQSRIDELIAKLEAEKQRLVELKASSDALAEKLQSLPDIVDVTGLQEQIRNVDEINRNVQLKEILVKLNREAIYKEQDWIELNEQVKALKEQKQELLSTAEFPDPHLGVLVETERIDQRTGEDILKYTITYGGVPFSQVNTASQRKAAFNIATSGNPDLKLVIVKDGDLLDEESLAELSAVAVERGFDVLIERGRPDTGGLVATFIEMENGQVKGAEA